MKSRQALLVGTLVLLVAAFVVATQIYQKNTEEKLEQQAKENLGRLVPHSVASAGPEDAPVTIVEFLDPECEACAAFYPTVKLLLRKYKNDVRLVVRYMPLHGNSKYAAKILEVMRARGKFWDTLEVFFERHSEWASHQAPKPELLVSYVKEFGVSPEELEQSLKDIKYESIVQRDEADARALGVRGTPTFFINGKRLEELSLQAMEQRVESELANQRG